MGLPHSGSHHRRRSSMLTGAAGPSSQSPPTEQRDENNPARPEEQKPLTGDDADASDLSSIVESMEMDCMSTDDDLHDDEETGLTAKQRRHQRRRRRKQRRQLDARIADVKASRQDTFSLSLGDKGIIRRLLVNGVLIFLWYLFSLSISIVSPFYSCDPKKQTNRRLTLLSQYNKWMFSQDDIVFPFPLFTTSLHMLVQFTFATLILWAIPSLHSPCSLRYSDLVGYWVGQHVPQVHLVDLPDHVQIIRSRLCSPVRLYLPSRNSIRQADHHYCGHDCGCYHDGRR